MPQTGVGGFGSRRPKDCIGLVFSTLEGDVDIYTIIFAALAVVVCLRLYSVLGQHTGSSYVTGILLAVTAAALGVVVFDVGGAKWFPAQANAPSTPAAPTTAPAAPATPPAADAPAAPAAPAAPSAATPPATDSAPAPAEPAIPNQ